MSSCGSLYLLISLRSSSASTMYPRQRYGVRIERPTLGERLPQLHQRGRLACAFFCSSQKVADLTRSHKHAGTGHEAEYHRFGDVARQIAKFEDRNRYLDDADQDCQQKHRLIGFKTFVECSQRTENHERNSVGGPVDQMGGRSEYRSARRQHNGGVQTETRINAGNERVSHGLRYRNRSHCRPGYQIAARRIQQ